MTGQTLDKQAIFVLFDLFLAIANFEETDAKRGSSGVRHHAILLRFDIGNQAVCSRPAYYITDLDRLVPA